jgi:hypothetical protein
MNAKERRFEISVVHRCFPEGGDSILTSSLGALTSEAAGLLTSCSIQLSDKVTCHWSARICTCSMRACTRVKVIKRQMHNAAHPELELQDLGVSEWSDLTSCNIIISRSTVKFDCISSNRVWFIMVCNFFDLSQDPHITRARRAYTPRAMVHCECYWLCSIDHAQ